MTLTVGSLFSGIGGLDLGLERAGMRVIWQSEIDPYANRVLKKHWPEVVNHGNIKEISWEQVERPDVICGGYPCQPFSTAGRRRGEEDPRHLWPWVREAISRLRPRYAILENVRGHLTLGGLSVIGELATIGYDAEWRVVSAASVGANHRRDRVIIIAYPQRELADTDSERPHREEVNSTDRGFNAQRDAISSSTNVAYPNGKGLQRDFWTLEGQGAASMFARSSGQMADTDTREIGWWDGSIQQSAGTVYSRANNGRGTQGYAGWQWWQTEPDLGRVANGVPSRVDRLKGLGNAVVPQVAEVIGRLVMAHANADTPDE